MELRELYGMSLHGEDLDAMGATDKQKQLIAIFNMYNDCDALRNDIKHLEVTKLRHYAGVEFCGQAPFRKYEPTKIAAVIKAVKDGNPVTKAANDVGMTRAWAREVLIKNGFFFDNVDKKWIQHEGFSMKSITINGETHLPHIRVPTEYCDSKTEQLIKFLKYGASLTKASNIVGMSTARARECLKDMGYVHKNKKLVKLNTSNM